MLRLVAVFNTIQLTCPPVQWQYVEINSVTMPFPTQAASQS